MDEDQLIRKVVSMANRVGYALVATSDKKGLPHVAASRRVEAEPDNHVAVSEWFCHHRRRGAPLPFGGVKHTGNGVREAGSTAVEEFTEIKTVFINYSGALQKAQIEQ